MSVNQELKRTYYVKTQGSNNFTDVTTLASGVRVLSVTGFGGKGEPVNIYNEQWTDSQTEDVMITTLDEFDEPVVVRKNIDIEITFIVCDKYRSLENTHIDVMTQHDLFVSLLTSGIVQIKSLYTNRVARCICKSEYAPTTVRLNRGSENSYILGTIKLHTLEEPTTA